MKIKFTDQKIAGEEFILDLGDPELDSDDKPQLTREQAFEVVGFWEASDQVAARGSYSPEDHGLLILAQVESLGDEIELAAWYEEDLDGYFPVEAFPFTTLDWEVVS